jgi:PAS domain S-box-containing protein
MSNNQKAPHRQVFLSGAGRLQEKVEPLQTRDKLLNLVARNAPLVLFMIDRDGIIRLSVGKATENLQALYPDRIGKSVAEVFHQYPQIVHNFQRALMGETFSAVEPLDSLVFDTRYTPLTDTHGNILGVIGVSTDITDQKKAEEALAQTEALFRVLYEKAGIGILLLDIQGRIVRSNPAFQQMVGFAREELEQMSYTDLHHPFDRLTGQQLLRDLSSGLRELSILEQRYHHKNGGFVWGRATASRIPGQSEETRFIITMIEDITSRKQIEQELSEMRRRLMQNRENERLRLAQELHDNPLQDVIALSFQVQGLQNEVGDGAVRQELQMMQETLTELSGKLRTIAGELRPPALAPFGLYKAIQSHSDNFQKMHPDLQIILQLARDDQQLPEETRLALFRIYQESLNNIIRHSKADIAWIRLMLDEKSVVLEIQDNGQGFELPARWIQLAREGHLGLIGARERTEAIGGNFEVISSPGEGTLIRATVPRSGNGDI